MTSMQASEAHRQAARWRARCAARASRGGARDRASGPNRVAAVRARPASTRANAPDQPMVIMSKDLNELRFR